MGVVLDLGCGHPPYRDYAGKWRIGVDLRANDGVDVVANAYYLPFRNNSIDSVICSELLEHLANPHDAVEEIGRVLTPGGKIFLTTRFCYPLHGEPEDYYRFTEFGLRHLFSKFKILLLKPDTSGIATLVAMTGYIIQELSSRPLWGLVKNLIWRPLNRIYLMLYSRLVSRLGERERVINLRSHRLLFNSPKALLPW